MAALVYHPGHHFLADEAACGKNLSRLYPYQRQRTHLERSIQTDERSMNGKPKSNESFQLLSVYRKLPAFKCVSKASSFWMCNESFKLLCFFIESPEAGQAKMLSLRAAQAGRLRYCLQIISAASFFLSWNGLNSLRLACKSKFLMAVQMHQSLGCVFRRIDALLPGFGQDDHVCHRLVI
jgi:hypothetical protein